MIAEGCDVVIAAGIIGVFVWFCQAGETGLAVNDIDHFRERIAEDCGIVLATLRVGIFAALLAFVFDRKDASPCWIASVLAIIIFELIGIVFPVFCGHADIDGSEIVRIIA